MNNKCIIDIETEDLEPTQGRIVCIGIKDCQTRKTTVFYHDDEEKMLKVFMEYYKRRVFTEIIGYNVLFDIRFIFAKCLKYGLSANGFFSATFTDLMSIMRSVRRIYCYNKPGTLEEWVEFVFDDGKMPLSDSVGKLYEKGRITDILNYNKRDVELTYRLWERVQKVLNHD
jgi:DNA polymerase elongation subunit (family B)